MGDVKNREYGIIKISDIYRNPNWGEGLILGSGDMWREMVNLKCPSKVESYESLGQVMDCLVGRLHRNIIEA